MSLKAKTLLGSISGFEYELEIFVRVVYYIFMPFFKNGKRFCVIIQAKFLLQKPKQIYHSWY